jgi:hypothetical protein
LQVLVERLRVASVRQKHQADQEEQLQITHGAVVGVVVPAALLAMEPAVAMKLPVIRMNMGAPAVVGLTTEPWA